MQKHRDNMDKVWNISGLKIPEGSKKEMMLKVAGTLERIPATFINGKYEGKTLAVISGLHGGEYDGIQAAIEISKELDPLELHGRVIILHPLSLSIFESGLSSVHPKDGKNLNRIFPPQHDGTVSDKIAAYLFDEILSRADFCLDMHGGGHCSVVCPHGYITGVCEDSVYMAAAAAAIPRPPRPPPPPTSRAPGAPPAAAAAAAPPPWPRRSPDPPLRPPSPEGRGFFATFVHMMQGNAVLC